MDANQRAAPKTRRTSPRFGRRAYAADGLYRLARRGRSLLEDVAPSND
ncbi:MAG TPA: hypothetical protein VGG45_12640 [Terracidiphilus sp.]|jgi:hypothetical protein